MWRLWPVLQKLMSLMPSLASAARKNCEFQFQLRGASQISYINTKVWENSATPKMKVCSSHACDSAFCSQTDLCCVLSTSYYQCNWHYSLTISMEFEHCFLPQGVWKRLNTCPICKLWTLIWIMRVKQYHYF